MKARWHLLLLISAAIIPVWLFAAYLLAEIGFSERERFDRDAQRIARQVAVAVEGEISNLQTLLHALASSSELARGDLRSLHAEAVRLVAGSGRDVLVRDFGTTQLLNSAVAFEEPLPPADPLTEEDVSRFGQGGAVLSDVYLSAPSGEHRVALAMPVRGPQEQRWLLAVTIPTSRVREVMMPVVPPDWVVAVGDGEGKYVARSRLHEQMTGQPGLPQYLEKIVGKAGTFTAENFEGITLLAGYYRSDVSHWFYTANVPLSVVRAPLWRSLFAIGAIGLVATVISSALAYLVGIRFTRAAGELAARAEALGEGRPVTASPTSVAEFAVIGNALVGAQRALAERRSEMETVLETVPAAVWFTYDPAAREVIRNRYAAQLMGLPTGERKAFGEPDMVIDTIALKDGRAVTREDRPLSRAMRGETTDNEEFAYILPNGVQRILLSSARPIFDPEHRVVGAVQISLDISERKRDEEQRKLLVNELNHRVKNTLAVVQSMALQALRNAKTMAEAESALSGRLVSLSKAHDILTQESWRGADLRELVLASIAPQASPDRFLIEGDPVWLRSNLALALSMAFHELCTNAMKHGALAAPEGTVSIRWNVTAGPEQSLLTIVWRESGGPPVRAPKRQGFGVRLLSRLLNAEPKGKVTLAFEPTGLVCTLQAGLTD